MNSRLQGCEHSGADADVDEGHEERDWEGKAAEREEAWTETEEKPLLLDERDKAEYDEATDKSESDSGHRVMPSTRRGQRNPSCESIPGHKPTSYA